MSDNATSRNAAGSYRPRGYGMSSGLQRARRRFFLRNVATGLGVAAFAVGVWAYSIGAVKQDVFDDVDEQARALNASSNDPPLSNPTPAALTSPRTAGEDLHATHVAALPALDSNLDPNLCNSSRGVIFTALGDRYPWLFEPNRKTMVWGAPPVDDIGRINEKILVSWR